MLVNQPATINFSLGVQSNNVSLDVSAAAQTLNTTDASLGGSEDNATIQALPSETRNVPDLLSLQPGVFFLPAPSNPALQDSRSGAVNGGRSDQGNITLDGVDDNDQVDGYAFTGVLRETQDSIEEFRVSTGNANADAGRSSGAQVSLVTKSGTNKFHGAAYEYNRPTITVANDFFNKQAEVNSGLPNVPGKLIRNIFGADVGGPIHKDKLFFFANYEGSRLAENAQVTQTSPTASYQQGIIQYTALRRIDAEHLRRAGQRARCRLPGLQHRGLRLRTRTQPQRAGLLQLHARGQRHQRGRWSQRRLLLLLLAQSSDPQHDDCAPRLRPLGQAPHLRARQSAEGHHGRHRAVPRPGSIL